ncbi:hypothetical protein DSCO28_50200 [Desulfosarcina ovata subsp. sediminis]|uniref:Zinc/iron-chelating domain-containing protein n=1 Tax=Desulfosarcina ovata subsp. sediminis TaxID=885957 RepID=A0A5K7ZW96_9BACT|nr:hypothetical protein DSCO28_50200 [Desulfosarcina ovata subsp. sediminis]
MITSTICKKCAACCKRFPYIQLSENDIRAIEQETALPMEVFTNPQDASAGTYFLQFKENGDCFFLSEENGLYFCRVYKIRPDICRTYPAKPVQQVYCSINSSKIRALSV